MHKSPKVSILPWLWVIFLFLVTIRANQLSWLPDFAKEYLVETHLNGKITDIENELQVLKNSSDLKFESFDRYDVKFPLFIYQNGELIYWNNNAFKAPFDTEAEGLLIQETGHSFSIVISQQGLSNLHFYAILPIWESFNIENKWLQNGNISELGFTWFPQSCDNCGESIEIRGKRLFDVDFVEQNNSNVSSSGLDLALVSWFILMLLLHFLYFRSIVRDITKKVQQVALFSILSIALLLILTRELFPDMASYKEGSLIFVLVPFAITFLITLIHELPFVKSIINKGINGVAGVLIISIGLCLIYIFSKTYWLEVIGKDEFNLSLIKIIQWDKRALLAYVGIFGMAFLLIILSIPLLNVLSDFAKNTSSKKFVLIVLIPFIIGFLIDFAFTETLYFGYFVCAALVFLIAYFSISTHPISAEFLLISIATLALLSAEVVKEGHVKAEKTSFLNFAKFESQKGDPTAEKILDQSRMKILNDRIINLIFKNPLTSRDIGVQKITKIHLGPYFDAFDIKVWFLNLNGDNLDNQSGYLNLFYFESNFLNPANETDYDGLYFVGNESKKGDFRYFLRLEIWEQNRLLGYLIIDLFREKADPNNIFSKILVDERFLKDYSSSNLSFTKIDSAEKEDVFQNASRISEHNGQAFFINSDNKLGLVLQKNDQFFLINSKDKRPNTLVSLFSFHFIFIAIFGLIGYVLIWNIKKPSLSGLSFRFKIQLFINLAFLIPMIVVALVVIRFMSKNDKEDLITDYQERTAIIGDNISGIYLDYQNGLIPEKVFKERSAQFASLFDLDYFIYDTKGGYVNSSKNVLWQRGILNQYLSPKAYMKILLKGERMVVLNEEIGNFQFKTAYAALRDYEGRKIGILGIPFFDAGNEIQTKYVQLISTVANIFVIVSLLFLVLSTQLSKWLTSPLIRLAEKLKITSFQKENETLEWNSKDEIGQLVASYNEMIQKLEESRLALSRSEKEAAWKEMAQQVAHEIKNPLTPMKLKLQQMLRKLDIENNDSEKEKQSLNSLIHQVDNLSDIASSFSEFARMPSPQNAKFNIANTLDHVAHIYAEREKVTLKVNIEKNPVFVNADQNMISRSFGNIILNGIQSVSVNKIAEIEIDLTIANEKVEIRIKDNGSGISEELKSKIFIPHFSTKTSGSGIGLALVKRAVEAAQGNVTFQTTLDEGTTFLIVLPHLS